MIRALSPAAMPSHGLIALGQTEIALAQTEKEWPGRPLLFQAEAHGLGHMTEQRDWGSAPFVADALGAERGNSATRYETASAMSVFISLFAIRFKMKSLRCINTHAGFG